MSCLKHLLIVLNVLYMVFAAFMIILGSCGLGDFSIHYLSSFTFVAMLWVAAGMYMACVSVVALIASFKESDEWLNAYGFFMIISLLIQIIAVVAIFYHTGRSEYYASVLLDGLMTSYGNVGPNEGPRVTLNWIQTNFQCCGLNGPSDWSKNDYSNFQKISYWLSSTTTAQPITETSNFQTPWTCCIEGSSYQNSICENYFTDGCGEQVTELIWSSIMILGTAALTISVLQMFGVIIAVMLARAIRQTNSIQSEKSTLFDTSSDIGYTLLKN